MPVPRQPPRGVDFNPQSRKTGAVEHAAPDRFVERRLSWLSTTRIAVTEVVVPTLASPDVRAITLSARRDGIRRQPHRAGVVRPRLTGIDHGELRAQLFAFPKGSPRPLRALR
jgi:hypothetical protein